MSATWICADGDEDGMRIFREIRWESPALFILVAGDDGLYFDVGDLLYQGLAETVMVPPLPV